MSPDGLADRPYHVRSHPRFATGVSGDQFIGAQGGAQLLTGARGHESHNWLDAVEHSHCGGGPRRTVSRSRRRAELRIMNSRGLPYPVVGVVGLWSGVWVGWCGVGWGWVGGGVGHGGPFGVGRWWGSGRRHTGTRLARGGWTVPHAVRPQAWVRHAARVGRKGRRRPPGSARSRYRPRRAPKDGYAWENGYARATAPRPCRALNRQAIATRRRGYVSSPLACPPHRTTSRHNIHVSGPGTTSQTTDGAAHHHQSRHIP